MKNNYKKLVLVLIFSVLSSALFAADTSGEQDLATMSDPAGLPQDPGTPIDDYLIPMLVLGIVIGCRLLRKKAEIAI